MLYSSSGSSLSSCCTTGSSSSCCGCCTSSSSGSCCCGCCSIVSRSLFLLTCCYLVDCDISSCVLKALTKSVEVDVCLENQAVNCSRCLSKRSGSSISTVTCNLYRIVSSVAFLPELCITSLTSNPAYELCAVLKSRCIADTADGELDSDVILPSTLIVDICNTVALSIVDVSSE